MTWAAKPSRRPGSSQRRRRPSKSAAVKTAVIPGVFVVIFAAAILGACLWWFTDYYTVSLQSPVLMHLEWPLVVEEKIGSQDAEGARADQHGRRLSVLVADLRPRQ